MSALLTLTHPNISKTAPRYTAPTKAPLTLEDRLGLALCDAQDAAAELLDSHGECECIHCENAQAMLFNIKTHLSLLLCNVQVDQMPETFRRDR